jgi:putative FmdB family regulatory protein
MPVYEHICKDFSKEFEIIRMIKDSEEAPCPKCKSTNAERQRSSCCGSPVLDGR